jgi:hypothetical protein
MHTNRKLSISRCAMQKIKTNRPNQRHACCKKVMTKMQNRLLLFAIDS